MNTISTLMLGLLAAGSFTTSAMAAGHVHAAASTKASEAHVPAQPQSDGEIKRIDKQAGKITVKHGPLTNLNMQPMTMVFKVKDMAMLEQVKAGDKVKFTVEKFNGILTVTAMQGPANVAAAATGATTAAADPVAAAVPMSDGEIKKVDKGASKITVQHGPLVNIDMPSMTMVFKVRDPAMLEQVKAGDKVKFTVEKINGVFTITAMQAST